MTNAVAPDFRSAIAHRMEASHQVLASRWLEELKRVVPVADNEIFPGDRLLGQIPALIQELAAFLRAPAEEAIAANAVVTARARELGLLRHAQHASVHQVLREYRALRTAVAQFIKEESRRLQLTPTVDELIELVERFETAIDVLLQTTVETRGRTCRHHRAAHRSTRRVQSDGDARVEATARHLSVRHQAA